MPTLILLQALSSPAATPEQAGEAQAIVDRLAHDLVCLCGRCERLLLAECECGDAQKERASLMLQVSAQDLTTEEARACAYQSVRDEYVARFGNAALATQSGMSVDAWLYVAWFAIAGVGGVILVFLTLTRWRHWRPAYQRRVRKRSRPPLRGPRR